MAQQTALQFFLMGLIDLEIGKGVPTNKQVELHKLFEQAKQMEKEQMKGMYVEGAFAQMRYFDGKEFITGEQYYNETYGSNN